VPIGSFIIATDVLAPDLLRSVSPTGRMMVDTKNLLFYWRLSPDGRVLFGGRRSLAAASVAQARDFLFDAMVRIHPQLHDARVERAWGGSVAFHTSFQSPLRQQFPVTREQVEKGTGEREGKRQKKERRPSCAEAEPLPAPGAPRRTGVGAPAGKPPCMPQDGCATGSNEHSK